MLLQIKNLSVQVPTQSGQKIILNQVSLAVERASVFALVGGSGSGKTTTGLAVVRLLAPGLSVTSGEIIFDDKDLLKLSTLELQHIRGKEIAVVFQEPLYAFNPVFTIGRQITEVLDCHTHFSKGQQQEKTLELLRLVGIKEPVRVFQSYPHQLSGGMRQRAMIAQAIALKPKLIIADEPTSSLDVTLQARIIELFSQLRKELDLSIVIITHDLGVVKHLADYVAVMSAGQIVEQGAVNDILTSPKDEYTKQLLSAI